ncbi:hypothetical protein M0805_002624 [Coniferiporia weirii]|nr:hypothetical protein M0805_002624 [Coniferiporia weirii]
MDPAEQRANAVAKLRRAASLPRMKDGRRPPMRDEAGGASESERSRSTEKRENGAGSGSLTPAGTKVEAEVETETQEASTSVAATETKTQVEVAAAIPAPEKDGSDKGGSQEVQGDAQEALETSEVDRPTTPAQSAKRRSRSRSRSRGSKDLRAKMRQLDLSVAAMSAAATANMLLSDTQDDAFSDSPPLTSPQAYLMQLQLAPTIGAVSPMSPFAVGAFTTPPPSAPLMPSLQTLQSRHLQGLFRSNSAAARMMAMHKLTGGAEPLDFGSTSPSPGPPSTPTPGRVGLARNNTFGGEERVAARQQLLRRLNERIQDKSDIETTSGPEDGFSPASTPKRSRRRSRRKSGSSAVVDDREFLGATAAATAPSTPSATTPALTFHELYPPLIALPLSRSPSVPLERQHTPAPAPAPAPEPSPSPRSTPDPRTQTPKPPIAAAPLAASPAPNHYLYDSPIAHRGLVVEDEDDDPPAPTPPRATPRIPLPFPLSSLASSASSAPPGPSSASGLLSDLAQRNPFTRSPFGSPLRERVRDGEEEPDEERVLYGADAARVRGAVGASDREISWVAEPVMETRLASIAERDVSWVEPSALDDRMPVYDEDEDEGDDEEETKELPPDDAHSTSHSESRQHSPRDSAVSQELLIDLEAPPDHTPSDYSAPSQHSATSTATANTNARESALSSLSGVSAQRGDTSPRLLVRTHSQADSLQGWPELSGSSDTPALVSQRSADGSSTSAWSRVKSTLARSGSSLGRRSRTNSIARERGQRGDTESGRESSASLASGRRESRGDAPAPAWQPGSSAGQAQSPVTPSSVASTPLMVAPPPRTGVSPIPPPSDSDAAKYANPKLFPFPGMVRLQEETLRSRGMGGSASSPDIVLQQSMSGTSAEGAIRSANSSMSSQQQLDSMRERKLSHQASDSRLLPRYQMTPGPAISGAPSSGVQIDYFNIPQPPAPPNSLPFTREGVKKWLSARLFPSTSQQGGFVVSPLLLENKARAETTKKPSLSDLLGRKDMENISDWDDIDKTLEKPRAPTSTSMSTVVAKSLSKDSGSRDGEIQESSPDDPVLAYQYSNSFHRAPLSNTGMDTDAYDMHDSRHLSAPMSSSQDMSSATPDPASSEESPSQSSHRSGSSMDSLYSPEESAMMSAQATDILQRLEQVLHADYHSRLWGSALTTPPRRLMLSSPMLQVVNCNTVKDRFLFLFSDILVIAKPMLPERDSLHDTQKIYPPDRKFFVKNVVHLKDIRLNVDRDEDAHRPTTALVTQRPEFLRNFVHEFATSPDAAVARIVDVRDPKGCVTLGRLLVQLPEIDRARLGEYLSRRASKAILKAYLDAFGFVGINVDTSLRIFLLSIHIPTGQGHANTLETLLDTFAARWYEANAGIVAFDRDLAVRLVRAIVRLNEALHAAIAHDANGVNYGRLIVTSKDFTEAFRRHDPRSLVPDNTLEGIYASVRAEKFCQARNPTNGRAPLPVSLKRTIPSRITYRRQSEPIVVRIPQTDSQLTIQLYGQDLTFDPPVLTFARSTEASFRMTGTAFGPKTMIMACSGPAAPNYSGLPLSMTVAVERAFMRNTFQLAFVDGTQRKRKYMFSVDDPVIRHEWTGSLKRQIEAARTAQSAAPDLPHSVQVQVYRAADALALSVLQETLLAPEPAAGAASASVNGTLRRYDHGSNGLSTSPAQYGAEPAYTSTRESYTRSQSRSQVYRLGAGRHEYDPSVSMPPSPAPGAGANGRHASALSAPDARLWTSGELALLCQQNSAIALVLSFLQAALPYDADADGTTDGETDTNGIMNHSFQFPAPVVQRNQSQSSAYQI